MGTLPNPNLPVTEERLQEFYQQIKPYLGLREMPSGDMDEIVSPKPVTAKGGHRYSTEEQIVGTWIDGSTLYEKTIAITVPNATTEGSEVNATYTITSDDISWAWIVEATNQTPVQTDMNILQVSSSVHKLKGVRLFYSSSLKKLFIGNNTAAYNGLTAYVTVHYTKTA